MGRTLENKKQIVAGLKNSLETATFAFAINYRGLTVSEITDLRTRLRAKGAVCKVTKNTFMGKAIEGNEKWTAMESLLKDSAAFILVQEDVGGAVKAYQEFQKATKKTEVIGAAVNSIVSNIAVLVQEIPTGVARAVQAVSDKQAA